MRLSQPAWSRWYLALVLAAWWVGAAGRAAAAEMVVNSELMRLPQGAIERAVSARLTATPLAWPLTLHVPLSQAVALLNGSGNATRLAEGLDGAAVADLPLLAGDYWQGVQMVCNAYDLVLEPGEGMDQAEDAGRFSGRENVGTAVIMQGGAVVLAHRPEKTSRPILLPCGVVLGVVSALDVRQRRGAAPNRTLDAQIDLRLEPHVLPGQVGVSMVAWSGVEDAAGRKLEFGEGGSPRAVAGLPLHLTKMPDRLKAVQLSGELLVQMIEPITLTATLKSGGSARAELLGQAIEVHLLGDGETTPEGQKGPGLSVGIPSTVLGARPHIQVLNGGNAMGFSMQGSKWSGGRMDLFFRGPKLGDGEYTVQIEGPAALQQLHVPLHLAIALDRLPDTDAVPEPGFDLQLPTHVAWPAAHLTVHEAIALLSAHGNQTLLELGVEESRAADLPAFSGTFWEGVVCLCRAFDLAIVPPPHPGSDAEQPAELDDNGEPMVPTACITGGQLVLGAHSPGRPGCEAYQPCGILLMGIEDLSITTNQGLGGISRQADIAFRLRLEPRFDASLIGSAGVAWTTLAGQSDGRPLVVDDGGASDTDDDLRQRLRRRMRLVRFGRRMVQVPVQPSDAEAGEQSGSGAVSVTGLPSGPVSLTLSGQATLSLRRMVRSELTLAPGGHGIIQIGGHPLTVRLFTGGGGEDASGRSGISVDQGTDAIAPLGVEVHAPGGKPLRNTDTSTNTRNGRTHLLWFFPDIDTGEYTVIVTSREHITTLRLPFTTTTP